MKAYMVGISHNKSLKSRGGRHLTVLIPMKGNYICKDPYMLCSPKMLFTYVLKVLIT